MTAPVTPRPFSSAQEIAESHSMKLCEWQRIGGPVAVDKVTRMFLSAITAAVAQKDAKIQELHGIAVEKDRLWSEACNERNGLIRLLEQLRDSILECESESLLDQVDEYLAPVAQTKEGEEPIFRTLLRRLRDSIDECDSEELLQEVDEALELKEPSPESNLSTQKALEFIREIQINALDASRLPGIQFSEKRTCPFCNAIMEPRGDFTHRPDAGQWTSHPRNDCILAGMWFHPAKWNKRV